jgi:hypothetical protein
VRVTRLAIPIAVLALAVAGCGGGSKVVVKEVPGGSVDLTVTGGDALAPKATATATADASETPTPDAGDTASGGAAPTQSQPQQSATQAPTQQAPTQSTPQTSQGGGATAPDAQATPPPGASKQQFETFCQQNPGAC